MEFQNILPVRSLPVTQDTIPKSNEQTSELKQLYESIACNNNRYVESLRRSESPLDCFRAVQKHLRSLWTYNSCAIDGSDIPLNKTEVVLEHDTSVENSDIDGFLGTIGYANAIDYLMYENDSSTPISKHFLDSLNTHVVSHITSAVGIMSGGGVVLHMPVLPGQYRSLSPQQVLPDGTVTARSITPPEEIEAQMNELIEFCNNPPSHMHIIEVAALAHLNFLRIHPYDGNNIREALLLMGFLLIKQGLPPVVVTADRSDEYKDAVRMGMMGARTPFIKLVAESVYNTTNVLIEFAQSHNNIINI